MRGAERRRTRRSGTSVRAGQAGARELGAAQWKPKSGRSRRPEGCPLLPRASKAEALIKGRKIDDALAAQAARAALEGARPLQHNGYKVPLLEAAVKRALLAAGGTA